VISPAGPGHVVEFPPVPLGRPGRQVIHVRGLPQPIYPQFARLDVPKAEDDNSRHVRWCGEVGGLRAKGPTIPQPRAAPWDKAINVSAL
jgi:hypothetical protein